MHFAYFTIHGSSFAGGITLGPSTLRALAACAVLSPAVILVPKCSHISSASSVWNCESTSRLHSKMSAG